MKEITCSSAEEFIEKLLPHSEQWNKPNSSYIFRGQGGDYTQLIPSAFRKNSKIMKKYIENFGKHTFRNQINAEFEIINDFIKLSNKRGKYIPNFYNLRHEEDFERFIDLHNKIGRGEINWPVEDYFPILSLAQHYGLPTCCIDWSRNPLKAAYFAANSGDKHKTICVYSLDAKSIYYCNSEHKQQLDHRPKTSIQYRVFTSHYNENTFINAQEGLFLMCVSYWAPKNEVFQPTDFILYCNENNIELVKLSIDESHSQSIKKILNKYEINHSSLFPDLNGIVQYMKDDFNQHEDFV